MNTDVIFIFILRSNINLIYLRLKPVTSNINRAIYVINVHKNNFEQCIGPVLDMLACNQLVVGSNLR